AAVQCTVNLETRDPRGRPVVVVERDLAELTAEQDLSVRLNRHALDARVEARSTPLRDSPLAECRDAIPRARQLEDRDGENVARQHDLPSGLHGHRRRGPIW